LRNYFEVLVETDNGRSGPLTPSIETRIAIGCIADKCEVIWDRHRLYPKLLTDARFIANLPRTTIELDHAIISDALCQVLVWSADVYAGDLGEPA
jgi:hypothetical protein